MVFVTGLDLKEFEVVLAAMFVAMIKVKEDVMLKVSQENKERLDKIKRDTEEAQKIKAERIRVEYESGWSTSKMK